MAHNSGKNPYFVDCKIVVSQNPEPLDVCLLDSMLCSRVRVKPTVITVPTDYNTISDALYRAKSASGPVHIVITRDVHETTIEIDGHSDVSIIGSGDVTVYADKLIGTDCVNVHLKNVQFVPDGGSEGILVILTTSRNFVIDSCTIRGELETYRCQCMKISNSEIVDSNGVGIFLDRSTVEISRCVLANHLNGINMTHSTCVIVDCDIHHCIDPGIYITKKSECTVVRCKVHDTRYNGLNIGQNSKCTITQSEFWDCCHPAIYCKEHSTSTICSNTFHNMHTNAVNVDAATATLKSNTFRGIDAPVIFCKNGSTTEVIRNTIIDCPGNVICVENSTCTIKDNTISSVRSDCSVLFGDQATMIITMNPISDFDGMAMYTDKCNFEFTENVVTCSRKVYLECV